MLPRIHAGREQGPGHRRFGGLGGSERPVGPDIRELLEIRELALGHELAGEGRVHAVEAHHEHALGAATFRLRGLRATRGQKGGRAHQGESRGHTTANGKKSHSH